MRVLVIGDFHGKISNDLEKRIKKINPEIILSPGDFCGDEMLAKFFFKQIYGKEEHEILLDDLLIYKILEKISLKKGVFLINQIKKLGIPIFSIRGNWDPTPFGHDLVGHLDKEDISKIKSFEKLQTKKFCFVDMKLKEFESFVLVGGVSSTSPQKIVKNMFKKLVKKEKMKPREAKIYIKNLKRNWESRQKLYEKNFKEALEIKKKTGKKIVFLTHNCPYNTKLDKVKEGPARGKHCGSYQERLIIKKYQPDLVFCGHIHENFGKDKIGKSIIYNVGSAKERKFLVISI